MIKSCLGEVHLTRPNYELCKILNVSKESADKTVRAMLGADTTAILRALADYYGENEALKIWYDSAETFIRVKKGGL